MSGLLRVEQEGHRRLYDIMRVGFNSNIFHARSECLQQAFLFSFSKSSLDFPNSCPPV